MVSILYGIVTALALITFIGIVAWAWSKGRAKANYDASMLPFDLPDEAESAQNNKEDKQKAEDSNE